MDLKFQDLIEKKPRTLIILFNKDTETEIYEEYLYAAKHYKGTKEYYFAYSDLSSKTTDIEILDFCEKILGMNKEQMPTIRALTLNSKHSILQYKLQAHDDIIIFICKYVIMDFYLKFFLFLGIVD